MVPVPGASFAEIPVDRISPNAAQPRQVFDDEAMAELVHSIREIGLLQPVVVRPAGTDPDGGARYELVMGERRWRATQIAGLPVIPAIVRETDDTDMLRDALLENLHRSQLNPLEEAAAYAQLLEDFGCTHEELAARIGRSRPQISNTIRLLRLSPAVQRRVAAGVLSAGHARALLAVEDPELQDRLAQRVVAEGISVRGLEEIVAVGVEDGVGDPQGPHAPSRPRPVWPSSPTASRTGSRPGSRSTSAGPRAASPSSSPASTTCVGSSDATTRLPASALDYYPRRASAPAHDGRSLALAGFAVRRALEADRGARSLALARLAALARRAGVTSL